jgi:hypothetical protein
VERAVPGLRGGTDMSHVRKFVVALLTAVGVALTAGLLPEDLAEWVPVLVAFCGAYGVWAVPNE